MAVENLYNCIMVTSGDNSPIEAVVTDTEGYEITEGEMHLEIASENIDIPGTYNEASKVWAFVIPSCELKGRYFYNLKLNQEYLGFNAPIYFC